MEKEWTMIIRPQEKLWKINLKEVWAYRDLITLFVKRNIVSQNFCKGTKKKTCVQIFWQKIRLLCKK